MNTTIEEKHLNRIQAIDQVEPQSRLYYMDNLRAAAMLLGILFHAALAYSPLMHNLWLTADNQQSELMDAVAWFSHLFRMPVFFLISGFFTYFLIEKRGVKGLIKNRAKRILFPFLIFLPLVTIVTVATIGWATKAISHPSPMLGMISYLSKSPDAPAPPITTMHLWFLYQLLFFILSTGIIYKTVGVKWLQDSMNKSPFLFLAGFPLLLVPALLSQPIPHPAPESFTPQLWSFGFYGLFFILGFSLFKNSKFLDRLQPYWLYFLLAGVSLYFILYPILPKTITTEAVTSPAATQPALTMAHSLGAVLEAYISLFMTLAVLLLSRRYLNQHNPLIRYMADASYWLYLIHLPLLFFIQFQLLDVSWNMWFKLAVSTFSTLAIGMVTYMLLVRWSIIGRLLSGKTKRIFSLVFVAALTCMSTGCSIALTRNTYYAQPYQAKSETPQKNMTQKHHTETRLDETAN